MVTITISGTPGSGKSTVAEILEKKLEIKRIYSGMIFRETADKYKMSLEEFGRFCEKNSDIDKELDHRQLEILKKGDVILEGRLAGWLAYLNKILAFKIIIDTDIETRAKRIVNREAGNVEKRKKRVIHRFYARGTNFIYSSKLCRGRKRILISSFGNRGWKNKIFFPRK